MYDGTLTEPGTGATTQRGEASWYDPPWSGLTAAHPWLPFGTLVTVTDRATGRSVTVVIDDRGPFAPGRIIDLSPEAFARSPRSAGASSTSSSAGERTSARRGPGGSPPATVSAHEVARSELPARSRTWRARSRRDADVGPGVTCRRDRRRARIADPRRSPTTGADRVLAIEFDRALFPALEEVVGGRPRRSVMHADAMRTDWAAALPAADGRLDVLREPPVQRLGADPARLLEDVPAVTTFVVMVQREVGERLVAGPARKPTARSASG